MNMNEKDIGDIAVITNTVHIASNIETAWKKIGDFSNAGIFLNISCELISGDGDIGSARRIGTEIIEILVGISSNSYSYVQTKGPMAPFSYHGCVALYAEETNSSILKYTICYDQSAMTEDRKEFELDRITKRFSGAAEEMKRNAERP